MKKIINVLFAFVLVLMLFVPITCFATEVSAEERETEYDTIFTRLWEFVEENKTEVVSAAGSALIIAVSGIVKSLNSKETKKLEELIANVQINTNGTTKAQGSIIGAINEMIAGNNVMAEGYGNMLQGYTGMKEAYEKYESVEDDRNRLIGAVMVQNTVILEILYAVFVHNKNLPQGVKDLVVLQYANGQKALGDDEVLRAIVESVRDKINLTVTSEDNTEEVASEEETVN